MMWANTSSGKSPAWPGAVAFCPVCGAEVAAKCGEIVSWHWAHKSKDCDHWSEPESEWHINWKNRFPKEWQEVAMGPHRADVVTPRGVIEFQKSSISGSEIREREAFYKKMIWVVDASSFNLEPYRLWHHKQFLKLNPSPGLFDESLKDWSARLHSYLEKEHAKSPCFRWLWPRKTWLEAKKTIVLDRGEGKLYRVKKVYGVSSVYLACVPLTTEALLADCGARGTAAA